MSDNTTKESLDIVPENSTQLQSSPDSGSDTGSAAAVEATQSPAAPTDQASSPADSAIAEHTLGDGEAGFKAGETGVPTGNPADPFEKRFKDVQGWATKINQEKLELLRRFEEQQQQFREMQQRFAGIQPDEINQWRQSRAYKPWEPESPEHQEFLRLVDKAEFFDDLARGETDQNELKRLQSKMVNAIGERGLKMLEDWKADVRSQERERRLNPRAYYQKLIREQAQPVVRETLQTTNQEYQQALKGREAAQKWMANKEVATEGNIKTVLKYMNESGMPFEVASAIVERDHYKSKVSSADKARQSAEEKERLLQGNAAGAISRSPSSSKKVDVKQYLRDKGVTNSRQSIDELFDLDRQGLL